MPQPKWKADRFKKQAEAHWSTVPEYEVKSNQDKKVDEHPHKGVAIYD